MQKIEKKIENLQHTLEANQYFKNDTIALKAYLSPYKKDKSGEVLYETFIAEGISAFYAIDNKQSENHYKKAIEKAIDSKNPSLVIWSKVRYISYLYHFRNYITLTPELLQLIDNLDALSSREVIFPGQTYKQIGWILQTLEDYNESMKYLQLALENTPINTSEQATILDAIGINYLLLNDLKNAKLHTSKAIEIASITQDEIRFAKAKGNLGLIYQKEGNFDKAIALFKEDLAISQRLKNDQNTMFGYIKIASLYIQEKKFLEAENALKIAQKIASSKSYFAKSELEILKLKLTLLDQKPDAFNELEIRKRISALDTLLTEKDGDNAILSSNWMVEKRKFQKDIEATTMQYKEEAFQKNIYAIVVVLSLFLIVMLYLFYKKQLNLRKLEYNKKVTLLQYEKVSTEQKLSEAHEDLNAQINYLKDKNLQINKLKTEIKQIKASSSHYLEKESGKLHALLESHLMTESNWIAFKREFQKEYPQFYQLLHNDFPEITDSNRRILLLQKLKFNSTEIAELLGITSEAVKKSKQRLKKKLGKKYELLTDYVN